MANEVSLNTSLLNGNSFMPQASFSAAPTFGNNSSSIWNSGNQGFGPAQTSNVYSDDFMMGGVDFNSLTYDPNTNKIVQKQTQPQATPAQQPQTMLADNNTQLKDPVATQQPAQTANTGEPDFRELTNCLVQNDNKDNRQEEKSSDCHIGKTCGTIAGLMAPLSEKVLSAAKSKTLTKGFLKKLNWKTLAVTSPIVAIAGLGLGFMVDGLINAVRSNKEEKATAKQPVQRQLQQVA